MVAGGLTHVLEQGLTIRGEGQLARGQTFIGTHGKDRMKR